MEIGKIAAPAAGDQDLGADPVSMVKQTETFLPRWPAVRAHISPAAPAPRMMTLNASVALVIRLCSPAVVQVIGLVGADQEGGHLFAFEQKCLPWG